MKKSIRNNTICRLMTARSITTCIATLAALAILAAGCSDNGVNGDEESSDLNRFLGIFSKGNYHLSVIITNPEGGTVSRTPEKEAYNAGDSVKLTAKPNNGWKFLSWQSQSGNFISTNIEITISMHDDETFTAYFKNERDDRPTYYVYIYSLDNTKNYTSSGTPLPVVSGDSIPLPTKQGLYEGHRFIGWVEDDEKRAEPCYNSYYVVTHNVSLYAKWIPLYNVKYNGNGATENVPETVTQIDSGTVIHLPNQDNMTRDAHRFDGWIDENGNPYAADSPYKVTGTVTLSAKWIPLYTVTFSVNEGIGTIPKQVVNAPSDTVIKLPEPGNISRNGYDFNGWNTAPDGSGTHYDAKANYTVTGTATIYTQWKLKPPNTPTNVTATAESSTSIKITWQAVPLTDEYYLYRSTIENGNYIKVGDTKTNSYTNYTLEPATMYHYKVSAKNSAGESNLSSPSANATTKLDAPTSVNVKAESSNSLTLSWNPVTGANGYKVYRSTAYYGTFEPVGTSSYSPYTNTGLPSGTTYYYKVSATKGGVESELSSPPVSAPSIPDTPTGVTATATSSSSITVSWSSVTGATGYRVYRYAGSYATSYDDMYTTSYTSYTNNTGLSSGTTYYYRVSAYNSSGEGSQSSYVSAETPVVPATPSNVTATATSSSSITVSWSSVTGATGYGVYRYNGTSFVLWATTSSTSTTYTNTGLSSGTTYYYAVSAYNDGGESSQSSYVSATPAAPVAVFTETFESSINNWVLVNGTQTNKWMRGTATSYGGSYSVYISNNSSANSYTISPASVVSVVHIYKDITFPTSGSDFTLTFYFKGNGESCCDYMTLRYSTTSSTPTAGSTFTAGTVLGTSYVSNSSWAQKTITLPAATFSGRTMRLVFSWINDGSVGTQPPAAIDNITITTP